MKNYFSHDLQARNDFKLTNLLMKQGLSGIGLYWCIVEILHEENGYIFLSKCDCIAFALRTDLHTLNDLIYNYELFQFDSEKFWSLSALNRIEQIKQKSLKASKSASSRWQKTEKCERIPNAKQTQNKRNAIKENKTLKENKEKIIL